MTPLLQFILVECFYLSQWWRCNIFAHFVELGGQLGGWKRTSKSYIYLLFVETTVIFKPQTNTKKKQFL